ncbi:MAG TPA: ATP-binding protein [Pyrinomonadaceae bacterium]|jgi:signal transduction histidine kinase|nr:ATP-binding protein [Pyrinomonadaceae bacterium]
MLDQITSIKIGDIYVRREADIVKVRDRVRRLAREMKFDSTTQIKITTAVSEITRNIYEYAKSGAITLSVARQGAAVGLQLTARDDGPGIPGEALRAILRGTYRSTAGMGVGLSGTRRLMDEFDIQTAPGQGTRVTLIKWLPPAGAAGITADRVDELRDYLNVEATESAVEELQQQNHDLVSVLSELEDKREQLETLNARLQAANDELNSANGQLRQLAAMREEFLALTTHDLRSPLSVISGVVNFFTSGRLGEMTTEQRNMIAMMERNTRSLMELVNDLLDASKLDSGAMQLDLAPVEVADVVREVRETMEPLAREKEILLEEDIPVGLSQARADRAKLHRILVNLLSNAIKFTNKGGVVRVAARALNSAAAPPRVAISITDTGIGIRAEDLARLFDKYEQARSRSTRGEKGTGLGLYITKQLVELHGGEITAESEPGIGSTFTFTLNAVTSNE